MNASQPDKPALNLVDLQERSWLQQHLAGNEQAFPRLVQAYRAPVFNYLVRCGVQAGYQDDLFQDIFLKIHLAAASYKPALPLKPWLFAIVANTVRNYFRKQARTRQVPLQDEYPDGKQTAEHSIDNQARVARLQQAISALPFDYREVIVLVSIQAIAQKEVAAILKIPLNTVKTRLRRARGLLLKSISPIDDQAEDSAHE